MAKHTDPITKRLSENIVHARKIYGLSQVRMATLKRATRTETHSRG